MYVLCQNYIVLANMEINNDVIVCDILPHMQAETCSHTQTDTQTKYIVTQTAK